MLPLDQRNLLLICGRNFIYNNAAGSHCFLGLAHGPALYLYIAVYEQKYLHINIYIYGTDNNMDGLNDSSG